MNNRDVASAHGFYDEDIDEYWFSDDGRYPNNATWPLLIYRLALASHGGLDSAQACQALFARNGWTNGWVNGVYPFHHYHSNTHEVLGVVQGAADVFFGGPNGEIVHVCRGDVVIIPAGVAHKRVDASANFVVVGAYPEGRRFDLNHGTAEEHDQAVNRIRAVPSPATDPVFGSHGPLLRRWLAR
ncbi:MAG: hypothetical protein JO069_20245 [Verrucomicrobia bacterium]|nr:hypothetical protein [Verrucomicrobiota bacterium]